ncbi:MAG: phosphonate ABC transporter, permease protein PhnE [Desulfobulbaceae bacterium]|nr:MAG: phosphonate ABC transporter, permease protein PhnE [Desulfobulbaceae bacterium]
MNSRIIADDPVAAFQAAHAKLQKQRRFNNILFSCLFLIITAVSLYVGEVRIDVILSDLPGLFRYVYDTIPVMAPQTALEDFREWYWAFPKWLSLLFDTIIIALLGTTIGTIGAFFICFPASRNLVKNSWVYFFNRRGMEIARSVPELVYAMIFVFAFGLGPLPGVLAIAVHTCGALGKLFSEVNENVSEQQIEGVQASGANWPQTIRYAVVPQVMPNFLSYALLRFEINVRAASVIGFVGAGGIGQELMFVIRQFVYTDISAIVLMIIATVAVIDISCEKLRHQIIGDEELL